MADSDLRAIRVSIAAFVLFWAAAGGWVLDHHGVVASVLGVGWAGSMLVGAAASLERAVVNVVRRERDRQVMSIDEPAAA
jgi:hypothetical protein